VGCQTTQSAETETKPEVVKEVNPGETAKQVVAMMVYNKDTGSYTFLEQMPNEERLMCILSSGHGKLNSPSLGASL
jgi:hypothetical protein